MLFASQEGLREIALPESRDVQSALKTNARVTALACSPGGALVAVAESGGSLTDAASDDEDSAAPKVRLFEFPSGRELKTLDQTGTVRNMMFNVDSRFLTIAGSDVVSLWDLAKGDQPLRYSLHTRPFSAVLTPEGQLAVAHPRGVTYLRWWPADLIREACRRAGRDLTQREWESYMGNEPRAHTCTEASR